MKGRAVREIRGGGKGERRKGGRLEKERKSKRVSVQQWSREQRKIQRGSERGIEQETEDFLQNDGQTERSAKEQRINEREKRNEGVGRSVEKKGGDNEQMSDTSHMVGEVKKNKKQKNPNAATSKTKKTSNQGTASDGSSRCGWLDRRSSATC